MEINSHTMTKAREPSTQKLKTYKALQNKIITMVHHTQVNNKFKCKGNFRSTTQCRQQESIHL